MSMEDLSPATANVETSDAGVKRKRPEGDALERNAPAATRRPGAPAASGNAPAPFFEKDFGIELYISSDLPPIPGLIKYRYSDFIVNEIAEDGTVIRVTEMKPLCDEVPAAAAAAAAAAPPEAAASEPAAAAPEATPAAPAGPSEDAQAGLAFLSRLLGEDILAELKEMNAAAESDPTLKRTTHFKAPEDKDDRRQLHKAVRDALPRLETSFVRPGERGYPAAPVDSADAAPAPTDTMIAVSVAKFVQGQRSRRSTGGGRAGKRGLPAWPEDRPRYCEFHLVKANRDHYNLVFLLQKMLRTGNNVFSIAGTKDKRGVTVQRVRASMITATRLAGLSRELRGVKFGNFSYVSGPLSLGDLKGNRFTLAIRNVQGDEATIAAAIGSLQEKGFINYFGMQRFGTGFVPTHKIGEMMLRRDYQGVFHTVISSLAQGSGNTGLMDAFQAYVAQPTVPMLEKILPHLESRHLIEISFVKSLIQHGPTSFQNAFSSLPRHLRSLYAHSLQSLIWNRAVSERVRRFGLVPVVGDLVLDPASRGTADGLVADDAEDAAVLVDAQAGNEKKPIAKAIAITEDTLANYTIDDVVLPMAGADILFPPNMQDFYNAEFAKLEMDLQAFKEQATKLVIYGAYRPLLGRVQQLEWSTMRYADVNDHLMLTDMDRIESPDMPEPVSNPDGQYLALLMSFSLNSSHYATMALREILKVETSSAQQTLLS
ncbi:hypothetical protein H696_04752 [Fonticula alba]|uniref:TRUD domain-containing protein n=1 Tax=Fonticula alba TaxID=691883 RepID=A0A058Z3J8_FONAL|nr:hypothetical protein H696_04752 [Fonticula alba]KCV68458.1 hypothetical protein H696_04752 [Fonticula alba]|eukprot:XP_009496890.1 hypothetical protein H696_04752 [Fonticula alba]